MPIIADDYFKIVIWNQKTDEEIAVITNDLITTANDDIVVKLTPVED